MKTFKNFISVFSIAALGGIAAVGVDHFYILKQNKWNAESNIRNPLPVKFAGPTCTISKDPLEVYCHLK